MGYIPSQRPFCLHNIHELRLEVGGWTKTIEPPRLQTPPEAHHWLEGNRFGRRKITQFAIDIYIMISVNNKKQLMFDYEK